MSEFERLGDLMSSAGGTRRRVLRAHSVRNDATSLPRRGLPSHDHEEKRMEKVVPFPRQVRTNAHQEEWADPGPYRPQEVCPRCKGAGWLRKDVNYGHPDFGKKSPCACKLRERRKGQQQKMLALSEQCGFRRDMGLSTFRWQINGVQEAFQTTKDMIKLLQMWGESRAKSTNLSPEQWLIFCGPPGAGKTHLAMALVNAAIDVGFVALFATVTDLLDHLRAAYNPESPVAFDDLFTRLKEVEVLVLDDLGTQRSSPWSNEKLFELLNYRYNQKLLTIITLNKQAWTFLDERMRSRLQDKGLVYIVDMNEVQDYRLRAERSVSRHRIMQNLDYENCDTEMFSPTPAGQQHGRS